VTGKLSKCNTDTNGVGIDTSELLRVYGNINDYSVTHVKNKKLSHQITGDVTCNIKDESTSKNIIQQLEKELAVLKIKVDEQEKRINAKQETIDTLKTALSLLEHHQEKIKTDPQTNNNFVSNGNDTGLIKRFKRLFS